MIRFGQISFKELNCISRESVTLKKIIEVKVGLEEKFLQM
jgi:hypothetical protein